MNQFLLNLVQLSGCGLVVAAIWMVYEPAALVTAGAGLIAWAEGRRQ